MTNRFVSNLVLQYEGDAKRRKLEAGKARKVTAFKAGMIGKELRPGAVGNGVNHGPV